MDKKTLDTNVLLDRPLGDVLASFSEPTHVIIPLVVVEELDRFKKGHEVVNEFGRATSRFLDKLRGLGKLNEGVQYEQHIVQVIVGEDDLDLSKPDHQIIKCAKDNNSQLVSQDINVRIVADALGIPVSNFAPEDVNVKKLYSGVKEIKITDEEVAVFYSERAAIDPAGRRLLHNQFVIMKDSMGGEHEAIYDGNRKEIVALEKGYDAWGITPKKDKAGKIIPEQKFLMHLLLDRSVEFVSAIGPSGCGKTFLAIAAALEQVFNRDEETGYNKIVVMRPLVPIGNDIGYLPGSKLEKLEPWMASTFDALEYLLEKFDMKDGFRMSSRDKILSLVEDGVLELEAMAHIRGRSIPNQFIIVDDAQNLTQHQAASIITRAGEGSKVVFLGDISSKQIDDHRLTPSSNGLAYVADRFKGEDIVGHITLETVVRSRLAQLGVEKL